MHSSDEVLQEIACFWVLIVLVLRRKCCYDCGGGVAVALSHCVFAG